MENEKKENKLKNFVLEHRGAICMGVGIAIGTILGGVVIKNKYADAIKLDEFFKKSAPMEDGLPTVTKVILDYFTKADNMFDRCADENIPVAMLPKEAETLVDYVKDLGCENSEIVGTILFTKKADS